MSSEKKQEARSVNPVQAQIKSLSGAILTIIDATYVDPVQREAVKGLIKAEIRRKMDYVTDEWILRTLQIGVNITKTPVASESLCGVNVPLTSAWKTNPEDYTNEELKRLQDLEEEVVEVDGVEFAKDTFKEKVVVDGIEFEKEKNEAPTAATPTEHAVFAGNRTTPLKKTDPVEVVSIEDNLAFALRGPSLQRHTAKANTAAEREPKE